MRLFLISLIFMLSLAEGHAEQPAGARAKADDNCHYTVSGEQSVEVPVGASVCFRAPPPYTDYYSILHCFPPLQEIDQVKRGDPRCEGRYEERERAR